MHYQYFNNCENVEELKARFRKLCLELHPDHGGSHETFCAMHSEYESILKSGKFAFKSKEEEQREYDFAGFARDIIDKIIRLHGIKIEIIGSWIWVSGDTFGNRDYFKSLGFLFSGKKKAWFYNGEKVKRRTRANHTMNDLRGMWGSIEIETQQEKEVAA